MRKVGFGKNLAIAALCLAMAACSTQPRDKSQNAKPATISEQQADDSDIMQVPAPTKSAGEDSTFSILFLDVGQADAAIICCDSHYMMIDGGNKADSQLVYTVLAREEISHFDLVVGTHSDEDHIGGIPAALSFADADLVLCPTTQYDTDAFQDFARYAEMNGNGLQVPEVGNKYALGSATAEILAVNTGSDANESSIVLRLEYGETSFLFTGDAEQQTELALTGSGGNFRSTVLKVAHHGSDTSSNSDFLQCVRPEIAVISVGENNPYGHPSENVLSRLHDIGCSVYRTDLNGDIRITSDGTNVQVSTAKQVGRDDLSQEADKVEQILDQSYVVNINTKKFHYPYCSSVDKMKKKNKWYYQGTSESLVNQGYIPCSVCNPQ